MLVTTTGCEMTWTKWTQWIELPDTKPDNPQDSEVKQTKDDATPAEGESGQRKGEYALRPAYQRASLVAGYLLIGVVVASALLGCRSRIIRRIYILPPANASRAVALPLNAAIRQGKPSKDTRVVIQCAPHSDSRGKVILMRDCSLGKGAMESELTLSVKDTRGFYWFALEDATVDGHKLPVGDVREAMFKKFYGEKKGKKMRSEEKWMEGLLSKKS
ncbi:hypothetical protein WOLCODRAFT_28070 [Wolfiporia cocos MD-104 SS10]|uniref:Uncharacterized protein n=1 Tax=Wolfiporia cocos (strain MD-104) TaxID=742152 RepID=A0A2H3J7D9_WOLCO|nr:hypothetical protein WOLCODRAFT_28070 [Wolfiporia cocos MD-104 SS10]